MTPVEQQRLYDGLAIGASLLCLIHCLLLPALIVLVPTLTAFLTIPEEFHIVALAFTIPASVGALFTGYRRHFSPTPTLIVLPGILLLALGALAAPTEVMETTLTVAGAILLAFGHALNWRALRQAVALNRALNRGGIA